VSGSSIPRLDLKIREVAGAAEAWPNAMKGLRDVLGCGGAGAFVTNKATRCQHSIEIASAPLTMSPLDEGPVR
jgi:hypothetical protein